MRKKLELATIMLFCLIVFGSGYPLTTHAQANQKKKMFLRICFGHGDRCEINKNKNV